VTRKIVKWSTAILAVLAAALLGGYFWLCSSLPVEQGEMSVPGLTAAVQIVRDRHGIPTIRAQSEQDAYFALGFVHAQDRLWQMDLARRAGAGRLSEILGERGRTTDLFVRTLGLYHLAEAEVASLDPPARAALEAYAAGINAYIGQHKGAWPIEYYLLGTRPYEWRITDSLVFGRLMALRLGNDYRDELERAQLLRELSSDQIQDLWPSYPPGWPKGATGSIAPEAKEALARIRWDAIEAALPKIPLRASASNSWAVDGRHTANGKPILANDPHLSLEAPAVWYLARIEMPGLTLAGATMPALPFLILGHNDKVAWGFTSSYVDTQDLFIEHLTEAGSDHYVTPDGSLAFETRQETIKVRGKKDVTLAARSTRHGPVISDLWKPDDRPRIASDSLDVVAFADASLRPDNRTANAFYALDHAKNAGDVTAALEQFDAPPQNVIFADSDGNIGFQSVGRIPVRKRPDGLFPVPGWSGNYDWTGLIPYGELPHALNPESGRLYVANNRATNGDYPYPLSAYWPSAYRARRIGEMLDDMTPLSIAESAGMQLNTVSLAAADLVPRLLVAPIQSERGRAAQSMLGHWDGDMKRDAPEPLIYAAWLLELGQGMIASRLGKVADSIQAVDPMIIAHLLNDRPAWCDDPTTKADETCDMEIAAALERALDRLTKAYGPDMTRWQWGDAHRAHFHNAILGQMPILHYFADPEISSPGDDSTLDRGTYTGHGEDPFRHVHGPGLRTAYDFADLDGALFMIAPGESGNILSSHYADFAKPWRDGHYLLLSAKAELSAANNTLRLTPAAQ